MVAVLAIAAGVVAATPAAHHAGSLAGPPGDGSAVAAKTVARATGQRVEVAAKTTETSQTFANPDGSFTREQRVTPVRVRSGAGWVPVDRTLRRGADGTVAPVAAANRVTFSGGGDTPLVRFVKDGKELALRWPAPLPAPALSGDSATYADVLSGVDLRVTATATGFSHVLVVKTAAAAGRLTRIPFGLETRGLAVETVAGGVLRATDPAGIVVFQAPPAEMWDAGARGADGRARQRAAFPVEVSANGLVLVPDRKLLTDPATRFPVEIDPSWSAGQSGWGLAYDVPAEYRGNTYWGGDGDGFAKVGYSSWESPTVRVRSYFQFDVGDLHGSQILDAEVNFFEVWAPSCTAKRVDLQYTEPTGPGLSWNNQPSWNALAGSVDAAHGYPNCGADWIGFAVGDEVADATGRGLPTATFGLVSGDESANAEGNASWKKFDPNPNLIVTYNNRPEPPTGLASDPKGGCDGEPDEPYVTTATPTLKATLTDPDDDHLSAEFVWANRSGAQVGAQDTEQQESGTEFRLRIPGGAFKDGSKIAWRVRGTDEHGFDGDYSPWCDITVDLSAPDKPPIVNSLVYPERGEGGAPGQTAEFTFDANGVADVAEFKYRLDGQSEKTVKAVNGKASAFVTPPTRDPYTLHVTSVDRAGNRGSEANTKNYDFRVAVPTPPDDYWPLDGRHLTTTVPDSRNAGHDGTFPPAKAVWTPGRVGDALRFDGSAGSSVTTAGGPSVNTIASFSVSAWVRLDGNDGKTRTAVSQDGTRFSRFSLGYTGGAANSWAFTMAADDNGAAVTRTAAATGAPQLGVWTHLTGVYSSTDNRMDLYVNGAAAGTNTFTTPRAAVGAVQIGRGQRDGAAGDPWVGAVDEVKVYNRALPDVKVAEATEIDLLATQPAVEEAAWRLDEGTGTTTTDASGGYRTATLQPGVSWVPGKVGANAVRTDGTGSVVADGPAVRTDSSFTATAWVNVDDTATSRVALSQDGDRTSGFSLMYQAAAKKWVFSMPQSGVDTATVFTAADSAPPLVQRWVHLTGVHDASVPEIRLYVNGALTGRTAVPGGIKANAAGPLRIGQAKAKGLITNPFKGIVDEAHLYTGVRTDAEIRDEYLNPVTDRRWSGSLTRYVSHSSEHFTATGPPPRAYALEQQLGWLAPVGTSGTQPLYACRIGTDELTSLDPACETGTKLGVLGAVYPTAPTDKAGRMLYRCGTGGTANERFDSPDPGCEGQTVEKQLGYVLSYALLTRYVKIERGIDRRTSTTTVPVPYLREGPLWAVSLQAVPGTVPLLSCVGNGDSFTSLSPSCEGKTVTGQLGWIWSAPPPGMQSLPLSRCAQQGSGERFDSLTSDCDGQVVVDVLGYVVSP
jgi:hypothetical protein